MAAKISLRCTKCKILTNRRHWRHVREDEARAPPGDILIEKSQTVCRFMVNIHGNNGLRINKNFSISLDCAKKSFYRAFNGVFGKVGRVASENVVVELLKTKCLPILLYGLEACPLTKTQLNSLNYVISSSFRKIFNVRSNEIVDFCRYMFNCSNIEDIVEYEKKELSAEILLIRKCCLCVVQKSG